MVDASRSSPSLCPHVHIAKIKKLKIKKIKREVFVKVAKHEREIY
jgi:hypothetical protein